MHPLRRDFLLDDLCAEMAASGVSATVAVQARQTVAETDWLLSLADAERSPICGVVGWLPLAQSEFSGLLDRYATSPHLKGLRHVVQGEPPGFMDREDFRGGIAALQDTSLSYDLLVYAPQLPEATRLVDRFPRQRFILDHIGKPAIRRGESRVWREDILRLAERPNVACKLSGLVTEADPERWTAQQLTSYVEVVLEAFGAERVMAATDWPVLTVGCGYSRWWQLIEEWIAAFTADEQASILGGAATRWYELEQDSMPQLNLEDTR